MADPRKILCNLPWALMSGLRNWCYDRGFLSSVPAPVPVVCIGNISVGGSGKTPLVIHLARELLAGRVPEIVASVIHKPAKPGVLLRGYGRQSRGYVLVSRGDDTLVDVYTSGDEARLLAKSCKGVPVAVCEDRVEGVRQLAALGVDLVLLDDGFQHRRLKRDLDLLVWDCRFDPEKECLLPIGRLRESPLAAARASALIFSRPRSLKELDARRRWFGAHAKTRHLAQWSMEHRTTDLRPAAGSSAELLAEGARYGLFCGLGNPQQFFRMQEQKLGVSQTSRAWPDHHWYTMADLQWLRDTLAAQRLDAWITTAKDAVRLPVNHGLPLLIADLQISLVPLGSGTGASTNTTL